MDVREFIVRPIPAVASEADAQVPGVFIYLLNMFSKAAISQFVNEASAENNTADPIGIVVSQVFSEAALQWNSISLIDILFAKYHVVCPVLWGIYGSDKTEAGRKRLGWQRQGGSWLSANLHGERMLGLGGGFAALSLRDYSKANRTNPVPNTEYWRALSCIVNTPAQDITETHLIVLRAMVLHHADRFIKLFGHAALVALRTAIVEFPAQAPEKAAEAAKTLRFLPDVWRRDLRLTL